MTESNSELSVWRILDASANRVSEGLRTIEEFARFILNDAFISGELKQLRHDFAEARQRLSRVDCLAARDTLGDVGTGITADSEMQRASVQEVLSAAIERVQQSLRCLEEYSKVVAADVAPLFESLRYRCYTVLAAIEQIGLRRDRLANCRVYVLVNGDESPESLAARCKELAHCGVDAIQLRDKRLSDLDLFERARSASDALRPTSCLFIVNDRADIAAAVDADGVHVGQDELPVSTARHLLGSSAIIGLSTHDIDQARSAVLQGADYIGCGPTFRSTTKSFDEFAGLSFLRSVSAEITLPSFAIGGINMDNLSEVIDADFHRVAVSGIVRDASDPRSLVENIKERLASSSSRALGEQSVDHVAHLRNA